MPQFNFQPIYSKYAGNNAATIDKLLTKKEEEYKVGEQYMDTYDKLRKSMQAASQLTGDVAKVDELHKGAIEDIKQFTEKGDYENFYNKIKGSVVDLQSKYMPFEQNKKLFNEAYERKKKDEKKWGVLSDLDFQKSIDDYNKGKGLQVDPITGQATGYFQANDLGEWYDVPKELLDRLDKVTINKVKEELGLTQFDDLRDWTTTASREFRLFDTLKKYGKNILAESPHLQNVIDTEANLNAWQLAKKVNSETGTSGLSDFSSRYNNNINTQIKFYNDKLEKYKKSLINNKALKRSTASDEENIMTYQDEIKKLKEEVIKPKDFENIDLIKDKLRTSKIEDVTNTVSGMLAVNNVIIDHQYLNNRQREKLWEDGIEEAKANSNNLMLSTGAEEYTPEKIGIDYNLSKTNLNEANKNYNDLLKSKNFKNNTGLNIEDKSIFRAGKTKKETLEDVLDELNKNNIGAGGTGASDINKAIDIIQSKFKYDWTKTDKNRVVNTFIQMAKAKMSKDEVQFNHDKIAANLDNMINDNDAVSIWNNLKGEKNTLGTISKEKLSDIKQLMAAANSNNDNLIKTFTSTFLDELKNTNFGGSVRNVSKSKKIQEEYDNRRLLTNVKSLMDKKGIKLKGITDNTVNIVNTDKKSTVYKINNDLQEAMATASAVKNLILPNGKTVDESINRDEIRTTTNEKVDNFSTAKLVPNSAALGNGIANLTYEVTQNDGSKAFVTIHPVLNQNNSNLAGRAVKAYKDIIKSDDMQENKDKAAQYLGKLNIDKKDEILLHNSFRSKNTNLYTINIGNGMILHIKPNGNGTITVDLPNDSGKGIPYINAEGKKDFKNVFSEENIGDMYKLIGYFKAVH